MSDLTTIKETIYDVVSEQTGLECQWSGQESALPPEPCFSLKLTNHNLVGQGFLTGPDGSGNASSVKNREFTLEINGYGKGVIEKTLILQSVLDQPGIRAQLYAGRVIFYDIENPVTDLTEIEAKQVRERSFYEIPSRTDDIVDDIEVGIIEKVEIDAKYIQPGATDIDTVINIDSTI